MPIKKGGISKKNSPKRYKKKNSKNLSLIYKIIGLVFLLAALLVFYLPSYSPKTQIEKSPIRISSELLTSKKTQDNPVRILIPKQDIDLPIVDAKIVNGFWELSENTASYGLGSGTPGQKGNTVIFAHARQGLFYNLKDVELKDTIYVFTKNKWYRYKVNKITEIYPNKIEVIQPTKNETLTLYTCSGFYNEKRLIVQATPQR